MDSQLTWLRQAFEGFMNLEKEKVPVGDEAGDWRKDLITTGYKSTSALHGYLCYVAYLTWGFGLADKDENIKSFVDCQPFCNLVGLEQDQVDRTLRNDICKEILNRLDPDTSGNFKPFGNLSEKQCDDRATRLLTGKLLRPIKNLNHSRKEDELYCNTLKNKLQDDHTLLKLLAPNAYMKEGGDAATILNKLCTALDAYIQDDSDETPEPSFEEAFGRSTRAVSMSSKSEAGTRASSVFSQSRKSSTRATTPSSKGQTGFSGSEELREPRFASVGADGESRKKAYEAEARRSEKTMGILKWRKAWWKYCIVDQTPRCIYLWRSRSNGEEEIGRCQLSKFEDIFEEETNTEFKTDINYLRNIRGSGGEGYDILFRTTESPGYRMVAKSRKGEFCLLELDITNLYAVLWDFDGRSKTERTREYQVAMRLQRRKGPENSTSDVE